MRLIFGRFPGLILGLAISFTSLSALPQTADPLLNGIAVHSEFGRPQFMAALYSSALSDNTESLSGTPAMRMELKILPPEGLTLRRFSRMWLEAVSINNSPALLSAQADNMLLFDSLFKDRLQQNDTLILNYRQGKGIDISLNKVTLGSIADDEFFTMLVRTWIGDVPLSTDFKTALLKAGAIAADVKSRFAAIQPSPARALEIAKWLDDKPAKTPAGNSTPSNKLAVNTIAMPRKPSIAATPTVKVKFAAESTATPVDKLAVAPSIATPYPDTTIAAPVAEKITSAAPVSSPRSQALLARQLYISQLLKKIRSNTRYPQRANHLGQSGSLRIALAIDRQGHIISISFVQGSQYAQLNEAALEAIKKSAPLPQMPEILSEPSFEFTVPISFVSGKK